MASVALNHILVSTSPTGVALVQLNRPSKRNALSQDLIDELTGALHQLNRDPNVRSVVLTSVEGSPFCAGADLKDLARLSTAEAFRIGWLKDAEDAFSSFRKPLVAAVDGFAFGGGFEIALLCDIIFASADARFGFPEIKLGTIPGLGGTQRLTRALGKHKVSELVLTGSAITASELCRCGVVNKVCSAEEKVVDEASKLAEQIASFSSPAVSLAKQAVKAAEATTLDAGLDIERALYYSSFSLADCAEGVAAFLEKRAPTFQHK
ncbi:enoyl-CoA hydratase [Aaosphaeria arxii CBS 175.79]|uniref:Enoyl-CoA hydratase n=1 Tax=Aaosphaeria arxii CBS 175.79 TaxID=1450172 RepID=A0A6A5XRA4_9PLEO|nr:enoyl-CoA hydratase [Aaosphaeria arxii CBS 175.79]KAF2015835.1 enoyl-CoA hydratase [Aaosphaeria arxii CBS 175.79]